MKYHEIMNSYIVWTMNYNYFELSVTVICKHYFICTMIDYCCISYKLSVLAACWLLVAVMNMIPLKKAMSICWVGFFLQSFICLSHKKTLYAIDFWLSGDLQGRRALHPWLCFTPEHCGGSGWLHPFLRLFPTAQCVLASCADGPWSADDFPIKLWRC